MPQLDFGNPLMIAQIVWLLIIFGLLYYIMSGLRPAARRAVLEERRSSIAGDLAPAQAAKADADAARPRTRGHAPRPREAQASIATATQAAQAEAAQRAEALNARLNQQIAEAEARIAQARDAAMGALRQVRPTRPEALVTRLAAAPDKATWALPWPGARARGQG
jgi:F-type H+-transporting ATPase subunit b